MKSWKTTLGGILGAISVGLAQLPYPWALKAGAALGSIAWLITGGAARDNNVPSEAIPKAVETQSELASVPIRNP